eukprot:TCONS_00063988-protein
MVEKIQENNQKSPSINDFCSLSKCIINEENALKDTLQCRKCHRLVHYLCTELPLYQIQICLSYKSRSFQCQNYTKIVPQVMERYNSNESSKIEGFKNEIKACENIMKRQDEEINHLKAQDVNV